MTIGRLAELNDIALEPDPQQLISRQAHCLIEREGGAWWVVDNGSVNGTLIQRDGVAEMVQGRSPLADGDVVQILGLLTDEGDPVYWDLVFADPLKTQPANLRRQTPCLEYDWVQARLVLVNGSKRTAVTLRPQEHKLIRYMVQRNAANGNVPVLCAHEELIAAVWGERTHHGADDLSHLVWEIRRKVPGDDARTFIEAERAMGYRLRTCSKKGDSRQ